MWKEQQEKLIVLLENAKRVVNVMKSNERPTTAEEIDEQLNESEVRDRRILSFTPRFSSHFPYNPSQEWFYYFVSESELFEDFVILKLVFMLKESKAKSAQQMIQSEYRTVIISF